MLEIRTILVLMSIGSLLMAFILWAAFPGRLRDGLGKWVVALIMQAFTWAGYALHEIAAPLISVTLADGALAISWTLKLCSLLEFQHRSVPKRQLWGATLLAIALLFALSGAETGTELQLFRGGLFFAATLAIAGLVWRMPKLLDNKLRFMLTGIYLALACGYLIRTIAAVWVPQAVPTPLADNGLQTATFTLGYAFIIISSFCILLAHKNRADNKNHLLAITDPLTGVLNRRSFMELVDKLLAHSVRTNAPSSLLMIDIDHFKRVNDRHGHAIGDAALKAVVARMQPCLREEDVLVRFGGEEFCVLMPEADAEGAHILAERIRNRIATGSIETEGAAIDITVSIGIATALQGGALAKESLFANADRALYEAKGAGRNRTMVAA